MGSVLSPAVINILNDPRMKQTANKNMCGAALTGGRRNRLLHLPHQSNVTLNCVDSILTDVLVFIL